jgi:pantothenate kinase
VQDGPRIIDGLDAAREAILAAAGGRGPRVVIGVTGAVASGKSTLARALSPCVAS